MTILAKLNKGVGRGGGGVNRFMVNFNSIGKTV